jgi:hypothetical protein
MVAWETHDCDGIHLKLRPYCSTNRREPYCGEPYCGDECFYCDGIHQMRLLPHCSTNLDHRREPYFVECFYGDDE